MRFTAIILSILCWSLGIASAQQRAGQAADGQSQGTAVAAQPRQDDIQALRSDLERMKVLLQQMQSNLAFVDTTQSPLKRQFQLEIDMWKTVIQQMERRLDKAGPR